MSDRHPPLVLSPPGTGCAPPRPRRRYVQVVGNEGEIQEDMEVFVSVEMLRNHKGGRVNYNLGLVCGHPPHSLHHPRHGSILCRLSTGSVFFCMSLCFVYYLPGSISEVPVFFVVP